MKIHAVSDLHLEMSNLRPHPASDTVDVIVLAGDIWKKDHGIAWARANWPDKRIVYVAGNHEFYGSNRKDVLAMMRIAARQYGVDFLENDELIIDGEHESVRFLGATLWTSFELFGLEQKRNAMFDGQRALNDFRVIFEGEWHFSAQDSINLHQESVKWLEMKLKREPFDGATVVVTHHAPSWESVVPKYRHDLVSACFASRLDHLLGFSELWLHGHTHSSLDYMVGDTRVVCNPRGYSRYDRDVENTGFDPALVLDVKPGSVERNGGVVSAVLDREQIDQAKRLITEELDYRLKEIRIQEIDGVTQLIAVIHDDAIAWGATGMRRMQADLEKVLGGKATFRIMRNLDFVCEQSRRGHAGKLTTILDVFDEEDKALKGAWDGWQKTE